MYVYTCYAFCDPLDTALVKLTNFREEYLLTCKKEPV